jgi:hypothetical protein
VGPIGDDDDVSGVDRVRDRRRVESAVGERLDRRAAVGTGSDTGWRGDEVATVVDRSTVRTRPSGGAAVGSESIELSAATIAEHRRTIEDTLE